jgi:biotin-dependent carboxylase-like uncharacterized protein
VTNAQLVVSSVGPFVSLQDAGRFGRLRFGVTDAGPMDRLAHAAANLAIGNEPGATAIEVSMGGLTLECREGAVTVAIAGGGFTVQHTRQHTGPTHADRNFTEWTALTLRRGDRLAVRPGEWGSWAYVAVAGTLDATSWLGSTSTHSASGFGGGMVSSGQQLDIVNPRVDPDREGEIPLPQWARPNGRVRVVMGPQDQHFVDDATEAFVSTPYTLTAAYDRMGVRLDGPSLPLRDVLSIPSEPIIRGSVQVAGDGVPTVLLADHQTTGGYPKIATVISADIDAFAQHRPGDTVRFEPIDAATAIAIARSAAPVTQAYLDAVAGPGRTLTHRLRSTNLISDADPGAST